MELKAIIGAMVSLTSGELRSTAGQINFIAALTVIFYYFCLVVFITLLIHYKHKRTKFPWDNNKDKDYEVYISNLKLFSELNEVDQETSSGSFIVALALLHDLVVPIALVAFINSPYLQILSIMVLLTAVLYLMICHRPYKQRQKNVTEIINKALFLVIMDIFLICHATEGSISEEAKFKYIGFALIGLIFLLIFSNFLIAVWGLCENISTAMKNWKKEKKDKKNRGGNSCGNFTAHGGQDESIGDSRACIIDPRAQSEEEVEKVAKYDEKTENSKESIYSIQNRHRGLETIRFPGSQNTNNKRSKREKGLGQKNKRLIPSLDLEGIRINNNKKQTKLKHDCEKDSAQKEDQL